VLLYGYCLGVRSSRQIERRLHEDIAFQVLAANQLPDHVTIARFRARHERALAGFLVESLKLCAAAGMVRVATVALDGTKLAGNAADKANRTLDRLDAEVPEILTQAPEADQREDLQHGQARGDELPQAQGRWRLRPGPARRGRRSGWPRRWPVRPPVRRQRLRRGREQDPAAPRQVRGRSAAGTADCSGPGFRRCDEPLDQVFTVATSRLGDPDTSGGLWAVTGAGG
jgi:hypothetical protein